MQSTNINLNYKADIVAADGQTVFINDAGPVNLVFFQIRGEKGGEVNADVVAGVRLHNIQELKDLQKLIGDAVKKHETKEA